MGGIDHQLWMDQPRMLSERCRGLPLIWTPEVAWFNNDWLGPTPHVHDDATEIGFLAQGSLEIQIGSSQRVYGAGDFMLMPLGKYHNFWFRGTETACFFVVVVPNNKHSRLRAKNFTPDCYEGDAGFSSVFGSGQLPSNEQFLCECLWLLPGESETVRKLDVQDRVVYVVSGAAQLCVNTLAGSLFSNRYQHIPAATPHQISNLSGLLLIVSFIITGPSTAGSKVLEHAE